MKTLDFHIISDNFAPMTDDGLFHIVQHHDYELSNDFTQDMAIEYAKRWFAKQMAEYGVNVSDLELALCRVCQSVPQRSGEVKTYMYYLCCPDIEDMCFGYELMEGQVRILTIIERKKEELAAMAEHFNYIDYNGLSA